ncbi:Scr1 family TA system antitoxin-like transcriptional regulator [Nocardia arizonensis]|uniref:Scr1 family TA system antitoxin-like transcriptional regulator n=1 Tax=Nocardia arizonensis TaxID=1141647 RepID=UPI0006D0CF68|nr:Scr1 family TA system antitoxin-like transcriptional regulator [Nocardia arizonensis]
MGAPLRTARKLLLGREIAHMIATAGVSQAEAAKLIETTQSRIAGLINGVGAITVGDLELLAARLGFDDPQYLDNLRELRRDNHKRGYWDTGVRAAYAENLRLLVDLEDHSSLIRVTEAEIIPGLVQCRSYIHALHEAAGERPGVTVDDEVQARLARQEVLNKPSTQLIYHAILSESCLRREQGPRSVMLEQLEHLQTLSLQPNVQLQVLPFSVRVHGAGMEDRFAMFRVPSPGAAGDLDIVVTESQGALRYSDDKPDLAARELVWARLTAAALSPADSREFCANVARTFRRKTR